MLPDCAERIRAEIAAHESRVGQRSARMTLSVGLAQSSVEDNEDSVLARADRAKYIAKKRRKNRIEIADVIAKISRHACQNLWISF